LVTSILNFSASNTPCLTPELHARMTRRSRLPPRRAPENRRPYSLRGRRHVWAANHNGLSPGMCKLDDPKCVGLLRQHATRHHQIGPVKIRFRQILRVPIYQPALPRGRQQRGDRNEAERCGRKARTIDLTGRPKIPERLAAKGRSDHQDFAQGRPRAALFPERA
jgi:hypothetical protein